MQQALQEAGEDLAATQLILDDAREKLGNVEEGIATLQAKYSDCLAKRDELDSKCQLCEKRLVRADKVFTTKLIKCPPGTVQSTHNTTPFLHHISHLQQIHNRYGTHPLIHVVRLCVGNIEQL